MVIRLLRMTVVGVGILLSLFAVLAAGSIVGARKIAQAHPPAGRFVEVGGGRLHVVDIDERAEPSDDDPPVVLLHGASGNLEDMRLALADRLKQHHRVILLDRPGHGWSEREAGDASPARTRSARVVASTNASGGLLFVVAESVVEDMGPFPCLIV